MYILETVKIKYLICLQFRYIRRTKKNFFANYGYYSKDRHFTANDYQNVTFFDIVEIWKKLKNGRFFHKIFSKSHFKIRTKKIPKMTRENF